MPPPEPAADDRSYGQILRSSSILGGASVVNVLVGLARTKVAALLVGPTGFGLIGLLQNLMTTASSVAGLGLGNAGTRQVAEATGRDERARIDTARHALFWAALLLALLGGASVWILREQLAVAVLDDSKRARDIGWLALGVALTVAAAAQTAVLTGLRRVREVARISVGSALLSTAFGVGALAAWGSNGIVAFVVAVPLSSFLLGRWYTAKLASATPEAAALPLLVEQWRTLAALGFAFMASELLGNASQLAVRTLVHRDLGPEALGYFQASSLLTLGYLAFVLNTMAVDFYPRLTAAIRDRGLVNRLVNEQTEVALLLAGPILVAMMGWAPWVVQALFSNDFGGAVPVLRFQVLGDVLKIASWPLGFILLASGDGKTFLLTEALGAAILVLVSWVGVPSFGVVAAGAAFLAVYLVYAPLVHWLGKRRTGFRWTPAVTAEFAALSVAAVVVALIGSVHPIAGAGVGSVLAGAGALFAVTRLSELIELPEPFARIAEFVRRRLQRGR